MSRAALIVRDAHIYDGSGDAPVRGDVAVEGGRLTAVGDLGGLGAEEEIDAGGLALAPGFLDVHTHDDRAVLDGDMAAKVSQGVTTVVVGNCGVSLAPLSLGHAPPPPLDLLGTRDDYRFPRFADYAAALEGAGAATNVAALVGHSSLRAGSMESLDRPATATEIAAMKERLAEGLEAGAIGLSTGLDYAPARAAPTEEVMALAELLAPAGAIHTTHMRDEHEAVLDAMDEAFAIGRSAAVPVVVSHFKVAGEANYGRSVETLARFGAAARNQPLALDAYPYAASSTVLRPEYIAGCSRVLVTWSKSHPQEAGRELDEIARDWGVSRDAAAERLQPAGAVYFSMDEADVTRILAYAETMIGSDGLPHDAHPHPRLWGAFPRVLGHYARERKLFPLQEAIRRMTGLPAARFGLKDRGRLVEGAMADMVLFDPASVMDRATFAEPTLPAAGIERVWVAGEAVWQDGRTTGSRPGRMLKRGVEAMV